MRPVVVMVSLFAVAAVSACPALAQPLSQPAHTRGDTSGFDGGPSTLPSMIRAVQQSVGGRVIEARFARRDGVPGFDVVVAKGPQLVFMRAAEAGGVTAIAEQSLPVWMTGWRSRKDVHIGERAKVPLIAAIRTAEKDYNGAPAVAAGVATSASNPASDVHAYNVLIRMPDGRTRRVAIDSQTGLQISDPQALTGWP